MKQRILIVDDDPSIGDSLQRSLRDEGFQADVVGDGRTALVTVQADPPDLLLLDLMLPAIDGLEVCRRLRAARSTEQLPILMLTAKDALTDRVGALNLGADDYVAKPFAFAELVARIRALLRRTGREGQRSVFSRGGVVVDRETREASRDGRDLALTAREFDLLALLIENAGRVLPRELIVERVWGYDYEGEMNVLDVYMHYVRQKLGPPNLIKAVRRVGFVFRP